MLKNFFAVGTYLSAGSADSVEVFVESTVACNHVENGSDCREAVRNCFASDGDSLDG